MRAPMHLSARYYARIFAPLILGGIVFLLMCGPAPLDPTNVQWLGGFPDSVQAWLGWTFYRGSPWSWPPGLNPDYGLALGNSIIYTDSIPLLAFIFKPLHNWLPHVFQYLGWWLLICFMLQGWISFRLIQLIVPGLWKPLLASLLFLFAPIFFIRLRVHFTLVGQFIILAALYLCLIRVPSRRHFWTWQGLLMLAALIHAYFLFMIGILWAADLINRLRQGKLRFLPMCLYCISGFILAGLCCYMAGYFTISPGGAGGFGIYKMNLLSPFNPTHTSWLIPPLPSQPGEEEGYNFLGTGSLFLLALAVINVCRGKLSLKPLLRSYWPLAAACVILTIIAVTNVVGIGPYNLELPRPQSWERWLQPVFRASGRFFWPVNYLLVLSSIYALFRTWSPRKAVLLLGFAVILQIADSSRYWAAPWPGRDIIGAIPMRSLFWHDLPYAKIRIIPLRNAREDWQPLGIFAALHGMKTDAVYLSRTDDARLWAINKNDDEKIAQKSFDADTLYILDEPTYAKVKDQAPGALTEIIDGFHILAPDYYAKMRQAK